MWISAFSPCGGGCHLFGAASIDGAEFEFNRALRSHPGRVRVYRYRIQTHRIAAVPLVRLTAWKAKRFKRFDLGRSSAPLTLKPPHAQVVGWRRSGGPIPPAVPLCNRPVRLSRKSFCVRRDLVVSPHLVVGGLQSRRSQTGGRMRKSCTRLRLRIHLVRAGLLLLTLWQSAGAAQDDATWPDDEPGLFQDRAPDLTDVIIVTGTRIPRTDADATSPVVTFERDEINEFRSVTIEDLLNTLPQVVPDANRTSNNPGDGTASINLRGFGRSRTLVLINGRRLVPTGTATAVDINTIPNLLLERVEIVSGGGSAVYGSDAVSGVVNFITRKDLEGVEVSSQFDIYGAGDGEVYDAGLAAGTSFANRRGHVSVYGGYLNRSPLFQGERDFTSVAIGEDRTSGELIERGSLTTPAGGIAFPPAILDGRLIFPIFNEDGSVRAFSLKDRFNFAPFNFLQTPLERWSGGGFIDFELSPEVDLYAELMYTQTTSRQQLAPSPAVFNGPLVIDGPFFADSAREILREAYDPDGDGIGQALIARRFNELGPRRIVNSRNYYRAVLGFRTKVSPAWSIDGYYSFGRNESLIQFENDISINRLVQGLLIDPVTGDCIDSSGGCVAVNIFGAGNLTDAAANFIRVDNFENKDRAVQHVASLTASGDVLTWPQGTIQAAGGIEFRRNEAAFDPSPLFANGDAPGFTNGFVNSQSRAAGINLYEAFAEIVAPVLKDRPLADRLEFEAGGRFSHYSTVGGVWTWKAGGQWYPIDDLRFRGVWQRAVRAPNVEELFTTPSKSQAFLQASNDFCLASNDPVQRGLADICVAQGMDPAKIGVYDAPLGISLPATQVITGNPDLIPERADTITAGADYTIDAPIYAHFGADYFSFRIKDAISLINAPLPLCAGERDPDSPVCRAIIRDPSGFPLEFRVQPINISFARVKGIDFYLEFGAIAPSWIQISPDAEFRLRSYATYYLEFGQATSANRPFIDCAGSFGRVCQIAVGLDTGTGSTFPKKLVTTVLSYNTSRFDTSLRWRWIDGMENLATAYGALANQSPPNLPIPSIGARNYLDLSFRVAVSTALRLRAGIDNVLGTDPPLLGNEALQANTDPSRYDVFGRRFYVGAELRFGGG